MRPAKVVARRWHVERSPELRGSGTYMSPLRPQLCNSWRSQACTHADGLSKYAASVKRGYPLAVLPSRVCVRPFFAIFATPDARAFLGPMGFHTFAAAVLALPFAAATEPRSTLSRGD